MKASEESEAFYLAAIISNSRIKEKRNFSSQKSAAI